MSDSLPSSCEEFANTMEALIGGDLFNLNELPEEQEVKDTKDIEEDRCGIS